MSSTLQMQVLLYVTPWRLVDDRAPRPERVEYILAILKYKFVEVKML
jgi:hypothetical protein